MPKHENRKANWISQGKTIRELISELQSFENQDLEVKISVDDGTTQKTISLVKKSKNCCLLVNCEGEQ